MALFAMACLSSTTTSAFADTYTVYDANPANSGSTYIVAINAIGQVIADNTPLLEYTVYDHGVGTPVGSSVPASFIPDNGSSCLVSYQGTSYQGVCNNGYEAIHVEAILQADEAIVGHDGSFTMIGNLSDFSDPYHYVDPHQIFLNSSGDVAYNDIGLEDPSIQAYNTTTPEPSSYVLLLTGVGLACVGHRRLIA